MNIFTTNLIVNLPHRFSNQSVGEYISQSMSDGLTLIRTLSLLSISIICTCLEKHNNLIFYQFFSSEVAALLYLHKKEQQEKLETNEKQIMLEENIDNYVHGDLSVDGLIYGMRDIIHHKQEFQTNTSLCLIARCTKCGNFGNISYKSMKII